MQNSDGQRPAHAGGSLRDVDPFSHPPHKLPDTSEDVRRFFVEMGNVTPQRRHGIDVWFRYLNKAFELVSTRVTGRPSPTARKRNLLILESLLAEFRGEEKRTPRQIADDISRALEDAEAERSGNAVEVHLEPNVVSAMKRALQSDDSNTTLSPPRRSERRQMLCALGERTRQRLRDYLPADLTVSTAELQNLLAGRIRPVANGDEGLKDELAIKRLATFCKITLVLSFS